MAEIDERYKNGKIYTIRNIKDDKMVYVGSTINNINERFCRHKQSYKHNQKTSLLKYIIDNDWTDWYVELYENYPCNNRNELCRREGEIIRQIGTINKCIAGRNNTEYRRDYVEKRNEDAKQYYKDNIDKINEYRYKKVCCNICGAFSSKHHLARHQKTKKCISKIPDNTDIPSDIHI